MPVRANKDRERDADLRTLPKCLLQLSPCKQTEELFASPKLNVGTECNSVISLQQSVQELVQPDWITSLNALMEVVTSQKLLTSTLNA